MTDRGRKRDPLPEQETAAGTTDEAEDGHNNNNDDISGDPAACRPRGTGAAFTEEPEQMWRELW